MQSNIELAVCPVMISCSSLLNPRKMDIHCIRSCCIAHYCHCCRFVPPQTTLNWRSSQAQKLAGSLCSGFVRRPRLQNSRNCAHVLLHSALPLLRHPLFPLTVEIHDGDGGGGCCGCGGGGGGLHSDHDCVPQHGGDGAYGGGHAQSCQRRSRYAPLSFSLSRLCPWP